MEQKLAPCFPNSKNQVKTYLCTLYRCYSILEIKIVHIYIHINYTKEEEYFFCVVCILFYSRIDKNTKKFPYKKNSLHNWFLLYKTTKFKLKNLIQKNLIILIKSYLKFKFVN